MKPSPGPPRRACALLAGKVNVAWVLLNTLGTSFCCRTQGAKASAKRALPSSIEKPVLGMVSPVVIL